MPPGPAAAMAYPSRAACAVVILVTTKVVLAAARRMNAAARGEAGGSSGGRPVLAISRAEPPLTRHSDPSVNGPFAVTESRIAAAKTPAAPFLAAATRAAPPR